MGLYLLSDFTLYVSWYVCCQQLSAALILFWSSVKLASCSVHTKFSYNPVIEIKVRGIRSGDLKRPSYQASPSASVDMPFWNFEETNLKTVNNMKHHLITSVSYMMCSVTGDT
jgi:hypothetical protein